jgi:hypothetical protein
MLPGGLANLVIALWLLASCLRMLEARTTRLSC